MACDTKTPWTITDYPYTINRIRDSSGNETNQTTGAWTPSTETSVSVVGYFGRGETSIKSMSVDNLDFVTGGLFKTGDSFFRCHSDCDVETNDLLEVYEDTAGTTKSYWRCIAKLDEMNVYKNLRGHGRFNFLTRREQR